MKRGTGPLAILLSLPGRHAAVRRSVLAGIFALAVTVPARGAEDALVINHVNVVDVVTGAVQKDMVVIVREGRIAEVRSARTAQVPARGGTLIDASGKFLIPGLWDMHAHIRAPEREFPMLVANGVLAVRDVGGVPEKIFRWREEVASGAVIGPRIVACGPIVDGPEPSNPPISIAVHSEEEGRAAVRSIKEMGGECVKVHDRVPRGAYLAIADEARKARLPLVGHVPLSVTTMEATNAGQRSIEHQVGLRGSSTAEDEVMRAEQGYDVMGEASRTGNFSLIPENIARNGNRILDGFSPHRARGPYHAFVKNGTYLDPTLVTLYALTFVDELSRKEDPRSKYIPASERDYWRPEKGMLTRYRTPAYIAYRKRDFEKTLEEIPVACRAGVSFLAGTDMWVPYVYPGFSTHDELALFVRAGLKPIEALRTATLNPARFLGFDGWTGSIQAGKSADLVLLEGDPLKDISNTSRISAVVIKGKVLRRSDLDGMLRSAEAAAR